MTRQKVRRGISFISLLLFPITAFTISPYLIIIGASKGIVTASLITYSLLFLVSLIFGRGFCGWVCPIGRLEECCFVINDKKAKGGKLNWIKYFIWISWIISIILLFLYSKGIKKVDFFYSSLLNYQTYLIYYGFLSFIIILVLIAGRRAACHYICPIAPFMIIGSKIKSTLKLPSLHLVAENKNCIQCKQCSKKCPMSLEVNEMVQKGDMKNNECILCGECVSTCPKHVIKYTFKY